jgi:hypothetical protein
MWLLEAAQSELATLGLDEVPLRVGSPPESSNWTTLEALLDPPTMAAVVDEVAALHADGLRGVAVAHACAWLGELLLWPLLTSLTVRSRAWRLSPDTTMVRRSPGEFWDAVSLSDSVVALTGGDPLLAGHRAQAVVLADHRAVVGWAGRNLAPVLCAVVDALHSCGSYARRGLWATMAGEATFAALVTAHRAHTDDRHAFATASCLLDVVSTYAKERIPRPVVRPVLVSSGYRLAPTKATCCLRYQVRAYAEQSDPLCLTCPRRPEVDRDTFYTPWIERLCHPASRTG